MAMADVWRAPAGDRCSEPAARGRMMAAMIGPATVRSQHQVGEGPKGGDEQTTVV
jgi:hypothetical protein